MRAQRLATPYHPPTPPATHRAIALAAPKGSLPDPWLTFLFASGALVRRPGGGGGLGGRQGGK